jgi:hypothetical protein
MIDVLFLDDDPKRTKAFLEKIPHAVCVETAQEIIDLLSTNDVGSLFLDHDLGGEVMVSSDRKDTGMEVVRWIESNLSTIEQIVIHTMNPGAGEEMTARLKDKQYRAIRLPFHILINHIQSPKK